MFDALLRRLLGPAPAPLSGADTRLALAALMVRIARTDGLYSAEEAEHIDRVLIRHHGLGPFEAAHLRAEAEGLESEAPDTVRFTRALKEATPLEDRAALLQAMWTVALADGLRDAEEDRLMRLVASLLGLTDVQSAQARQRAGRQP